MKQVFLAIVVAAAFFGAEWVCGMEHKTEQKPVPAFRKYVQITFNNYTDDTQIFINEDVVVIKPSHKNVTIHGVEDVRIKTIKGRYLKSWLIHHLQAITAISVDKIASDKQYSITTEPGSEQEIITLDGGDN